MTRVDGHDHHRDDDAERTRDDHRHGHAHGAREGHGHRAHAHARAGRDGPGARLRHLLTPHSHDSADAVDPALETTAEGLRAVKLSLAGLLLTALAQAGIVALSGSVALLADTIHNFSDALTAVPLWIAFALGRRAMTRRYTYGYRRAEDLAGLFIVGMIALSAMVAGWQSLQRLLAPRAIDHIGWVIAAGIVGFLGNEAVARYRIVTGHRIGSAALVADGYHARTDGFTSLGVIGGAVGSALGVPRADPVVGLVITVAIVVVLWGASRSVFRRLMDGVDPELVDSVERAAATVAGVRSVSDVRVRWVGHRLDLRLNVVVDGALTVAQGHEVAEQVSHALHHELGRVDHVVVHVDPDDADTDAHALTRHHAPGAPH